MALNRIMGTKLSVVVIIILSDDENNLNGACCAQSLRLPNGFVMPPLSVVLKVDEG